MSRQAARGHKVVEADKSEWRVRIERAARRAGIEPPPYRKREVSEHSLPSSRRAAMRRFVYKQAEKGGEEGAEVWQDVKSVFTKMSWEQFQRFKSTLQDFHATYNRLGRSFMTVNYMIEYVAHQEESLLQEMKSLPSYMFFYH